MSSDKEAPGSAAPTPDDAPTKVLTPSQVGSAPPIYPEPVATDPLPDRLDGSSLALSDIEGEVRFVDYLVERDWGCFGGEVEPAIFGIQSREVEPGRFIEDGSYRLFDGTVFPAYWEYIDGALWLGLDGDDPLKITVPEIISVPGAVDVWIEHPGKPELDAYTEITFENVQMYGLVPTYTNPNTEQPEISGTEISCRG
ncbi:hypothetical protein [Arthrobacter zhaoguopingii]|uniref:hypothetical protein n=1 Tax=Arthrobacter zhaoguopingii TaxID=2681491 RepID=UPI00135CB1D7|nr:hypothetical protein [Arthrobacter zhaoguopingii]